MGPGIANAVFMSGPGECNTGGTLTHLMGPKKRKEGLAGGE